MYSLLVSPTDAIDGTSDCNDMHNVVTAEGIAVVIGAATTGYRPVGENGEINDTFTAPGTGGGTVTVTVSLTTN
jgi:hypothetical protein